MTLDELVVGEAVNPGLRLHRAGLAQRISEGQDSRLEREEMEKLFLSIA